jgi:hypothetical protein
MLERRQWFVERRDGKLMYVGSRTGCRRWYGSNGGARMDYRLCYMDAADFACEHPSVKVGSQDGIVCDDARFESRGRGRRRSEDEKAATETQVQSQRDPDGLRGR